MDLLMIFFEDTTDGWYDHYGYGCWREEADGTLNVPNPMSWILDMIEGWK